MLHSFVLFYAFLKIETEKSKTEMLITKYVINMLNHSIFYEDYNRTTNCIFSIGLTLMCHRA